MAEKREPKVTVFIPPFVKVRKLRSSFGRVKAVKIPVEEFVPADVVVREEDFPKGSEGAVQ